MPKVTTKTKPKYLPYAKGFICPDDDAKLAAVGFKNCSIPSAYQAHSKFFNNIPQPNSIDDWLAQYNEEGQSYSEFLDECPWLSSRKVKYIHHQFISKGKNLPSKYPDGKIYIVPVGDFDENQFVKFENLLDYSKKFLCLPIATLSPFKVQRTKEEIIWIDEPSTDTNKRTSARTRITHLESRYNYRTENIQLQVDGVLSKLRQNIPRDALCLIGLTCFDLYSDPPDLFVAGMAAGSQRVAIFSLNRYDPCLEFSKESWFERYNHETYSDNERKGLILQRSCKLVVHEICHLLGIDHCIFYECCMNGSGHLEEDFRQPMYLCPVDLHKLQTLCGFNVLTRYEGLKQFFSDHNMKEELEWIEKRIKYMKENQECS